MLTLTDNVVILVLVMLASLLLLVCLNRIWPVPTRRSEGDLIGWQLSVLGTTYAVVLGFMLYTAWTNFVAAELNVNLEANALRNTFRLAEGLPAPQREQLQTQARAYADAVVTQDWPMMARGQIPEGSHEVNEKMWRTLMSIKAASSSESTAADHALSELTTLTAHRRTRLLQSVSKLPVVFWGVLLAGGTLTLVSASLFGSVKPRVHAFMVFSTTLIVTLVMLAIADVNQPFRGWVHVSDYAFVRAQEYMR
ncbi:MAG TPA: DUF4239 domain-containing protein [Steroidobacteraceae bacterium]|jgi:hypothetical protein|nr:DUF4239 domain-containing protein [Steroidobacteraceae bacterium]